MPRRQPATQPTPEPLLDPVAERELGEALWALAENVAAKRAAAERRPKPEQAQ